MISNLEQMHKPNPCKQNLCGNQKTASNIEWNICLPCGLLVGPQEDFHILVDVLHSSEGFKEILRN